jgi:molybdopterin adenylyltransferase
MSHKDHEAWAAEQTSAIRCGLITISDTRTIENDTSGALMRSMLQEAGHTIGEYIVVKDEPRQIVEYVQAFNATGCKVMITSGGTGIARRDSTFEAIDSLLEKRLPGFGEIFRMLSYTEIGAAAMLSRATAGTYRNSLIFCLPGSTAAVRLALEKLVIPQLAHVVWETVR